VPLTTGSLRLAAAPEHPDGYELWAASMPPRTRIEIGIVNNMPDAALVPTERQFSGLIEQASGDLDINISLYTLESLPRQPGTLLAIGQTYRPARELRAHSLDALIVTGAEPHAPDLRDEPYWRELAGLAAWAQSHTISCLFSCLAAHAEVLRRDKIVRRRQPIKLHGVFEAEVVASHELVEGLGARASIPHSRYNGLDEGELAAKGYVTLTRSREGGVDMFVLEEENLSVFLQGHPEYDADTLAREYRRDVQRFMSSELSAPPLPPRDYFPPAVAARVAAWVERSSNGVLCEFPPEALLQGEAAWRAASVRLFRNWLAAVARRKAAQRAPTLSAGQCET
jgi:homoserine O-succinyltransferase/O-acetyltransferase